MLIYKNKCEAYRVCVGDTIYPDKATINPKGDSLFKVLKVTRNNVKVSLLLSKPDSMLSFTYTVSSDEVLKGVFAVNQ
jgi:hypothetical protein